MSASCMDQRATHLEEDPNPRFHDAAEDIRDGPRIDVKQQVQKKKLGLDSLSPRETRSHPSLNSDHACWWEANEMGPLLLWTPSCVTVRRGQQKAAEVMEYTGGRRRSKTVDLG